MRCVLPGAPLPLWFPSPPAFSQGFRVHHGLDALTTNAVENDPRDQGRLGCTQGAIFPLHHGRLKRRL